MRGGKGVVRVEVEGRERSCEGGSERGGERGVRGEGKEL